MTLQYMRTECWMPKDTDTLSICNTYCFSATAMVALPAIMLCYTHIACLVVLCIYLSIYIFMYFCQVLAYLVVVSVAQAGVD